MPWGERQLAEVAEDDDHDTCRISRRNAWLAALTVFTSGQLPAILTPAYFRYLGVEDPPAGEAVLAAIHRKMIRVKDIRDESRNSRVGNLCLCLCSRQELFLLPQVLQGALRCCCLCPDILPETQPLCLIVCVCDAGLARLFGISSRRHLPSLRATLSLLPRTLPRRSSSKARATSRYCCRAPCGVVVCVLTYFQRLNHCASLYVCVTLVWRACLVSAQGGTCPL